MPIMQERNASMQELNSADALNVQDRSWGAEWYDSTGLFGFTSGGGPYTLNLNVERINSAPEIYSMVNDELTITEAGLYLFSAQMMVAQNGTTNVATNRLWLEEDPDTGVYAAFPHAASFFNMPSIIGLGQGGFVTLVQVGIDYKYRLRFQQVYGTSSVNTVPDGSKLTVVRLFKNG